MRDHELNADRKPEVIDWSPWTHPKAKRWFAELLEQTHLPLMMEHAVDKSDSTLDEGETRLMVSLALLIGREGIWPDSRKTVLRTIARQGNVVANRSTKSTGQPVSLSEHRSRAGQQKELEHELELLRRRIGMSNRKSSCDAPKWGKFWS